MESTFLTDRGKVRSHNEDNGGIFTNNHSLLAVVADGMGGHKAGDVASEMAVKELAQLWESIDGFLTPDQAEKWLEETIQLVNQKVFEYARHNEECDGMGTTLVAAVCTDDFITIGHIGDSRCYILNGYGLSQITSDHSLVNELVKSGQISKEDAEHHPRKNVLMRALGTEQQIDLDIKTIDVEAGDRLLLCSDGLTNKVSDHVIEEVLKENMTVEKQAKTLIHYANESGGEDNISVAIIQFLKPEDGSE